MKSFILTLQFLTRIPIKINIDSDEEDFAKGVVYFPIAGLIIGAFNLAVYAAAERVISGMFPAVCSVAANAVITGAMHIDGLADTCDGIFSARPRDRMLEIMRDSRIGTNGTIAIMFDFLFRISLLAVMRSTLAYAALLMSPVAAKTLMVILMKTSVYARKGPGMGGLYLEKQTSARTVITCIIGLFLLTVFSGFPGLIAFAVCSVVCMLYRLYIYSKINGMTGDTLGAANEVMEIVFLMVLVIIGGNR